MIRSMANAQTPWAPSLRERHKRFYLAMRMLQGSISSKARPLSSIWTSFQTLCGPFTLSMALVFCY